MPPPPGRLPAPRHRYDQLSRRYRTLPPVDRALVDLLLAPAKDPSSSAKNVWRKARARDRVTQGESAQHSPDRVVLAWNATAKFRSLKSTKNILARLVSDQPPSLIILSNNTRSGLCWALSPCVTRSLARALRHTFWRAGGIFGGGQKQVNERSVEPGEGFR